MEKYCVWYSIGVQCRKYTQLFNTDIITEAAHNGWLELSNGNIIPWHNIQIIQRLKG
jgi:hypothetical protein